MQQFVTEPDGATQRYTRLCTAEEICVSDWDHMGLSAGQEGEGVQGPVS